MPKLLNSSKHIAFVKAAFPKPAHDAQNPKVWFCVQNKGGDVLFHVEKKVGGRPLKFKTAAAINAYLNKLQMFPDAMPSVSKDMQICGGLIWIQNGQVHMNCTVKAQGGGKSTLKKALPLGKRLGFPGLADVQLVKEASVGKEAEQDAALLEQVAAVRSTNPDHEKFLKLHLQVTQTLPRLPGRGKAKDLDRLEKLARRLEKYQKVSLTKKLRKLTPPVTGLTSRELSEAIAQVKGLVEQARAEENRGAVAQATAEAETELAQSGDTARLAEYAASLNMSTADLDGFMRSAGEYMDHCDQLFSDFTPDQIKQLYKHLGADMDWELFFARLNAVDDLARLVLEVWEGDLNRFGKALRSRVVNFNVVMLSSLARERDWDGRRVDAFLKNQAARAGAELKEDKKAQKRKAKADIELFRIPDLGVYLKARAFQEYAVCRPKNKWPISLWYEVEAQNPEALEQDLDNPVIAQKIKDAGQFDLMINKIVAAYKEIVKPLMDDPGSKDLKVIGRELSAAVNRITEEHLDLAQRKTQEQFNLHAEVVWKKRRRIAAVTFAAATAIAGVIATIAAFATMNVAAGILQAIGTYKNIATLMDDCWTMRTKIETVLDNVKGDLEYIDDMYRQYPYKEDDEEFNAADMEGAAITLGLIVPKEILSTVTRGAVKSADAATKRLTIAETNTAILEDNANQLGSDIVRAIDDSRVATLQVRDLHAQLVEVMKDGNQLTPEQLRSINSIIPTLNAAMDHLKQLERHTNKLLVSSIADNKRVDNLQSSIRTCKGFLGAIKNRRPDWVDSYKWWTAAGELGANIIVGGTFAEFGKKDWIGWMEVGTNSLDILKKSADEIEEVFATI